jgi:hypothetical protein
VKQAKLKQLSAYSLIAVAASAGTLLAMRARAAGIPEKDALTYTGYLEDADGNALSGKHSISVRFVASATATKALCTGEAPDLELIAGRFQVALPDCAEVVKANPELFVDVQVDGAWLGATKLGAVPYAIEAGRASSSAGELETRLAAIEARLAKRSGFHAAMTADQIIANAMDPVVQFNTEDWDANAEYDPTSGTFTPKQAGLYALTCSVRFEAGNTSTNGWWNASMKVNTVSVAQDGAYGDGWTVFRNAIGLVSLKAGDKVTCHATQQSGAARPVSKGGSHFEAVRLDSAP